jgi:hypothetical protein
MRQPGVGIVDPNDFVGLRYDRGQIRVNDLDRMIGREPRES